jgi:hypothetical protein
MAIRTSLTLCTVASLFVGGVAFAQQTGTTTVLRREKTSNRAPLLKKSMKATKSALSAARLAAASAAAVPVLSPCPGPKAEQRASRENKRLQRAVMVTRVAGPPQ